MTRPERSSHDAMPLPGLEATPLPAAPGASDSSPKSDGLFDSFALAGFSDASPVHPPTVILHNGPTPASDPETQFGLPSPLANHLRYTVLEMLGIGGMGAVYKALHRMMGRTVALKVISPRWIDDETAIARFRQEVRAAARLCHPNIVTAFDAEQAGDCHFLVMEYVEGVNLARLVEEHGPLPVGAACEYLRQAAVGLQHAHEQGMVHRDVKPQNLMVTRQGQVKILDFGLARFASERRSTPNLSASPAEITMAGEVLGTPDYLAPEQARNARGVDGRADLYSLGATAYFLLTGRVPFPAETGVEKLLRQCMDEPIPVEQWRPEVPRPVIDLIRKLMAKQAEGRYQTAQELAEALTPFATSGAIPPRMAGEDRTDVAAAVTETPRNPHRQATPRPTALAPEPAAAPADPAPAAPAPAVQPPEPLRQRTVTPVRVLLCAILGLATALGFSILRSRGKGDDGSKDPGTPTHPANPGQNTKTRPRVLYVLPSRQFSHKEYALVRQGLELKGIEVVIASGTTDPASPEDGTGGKAVKPDVAMSQVRVGDYDALVIGGGAGVGDLTGATKEAATARRLVAEMMSARKPVSALGLGPLVLADAGMVRGKRIACAAAARDTIAGAGGQPVARGVATTEPAAGHGYLITAEGDRAATEFADALSGILVPAPRIP